MKNFEKYLHLFKGNHLPQAFQKATYLIQKKKMVMYGNVPDVKMKESIEKEGNDADVKWKDLEKIEDYEIEPNDVPVPDFTAIVHRGLVENKSQEVWNLVSNYVRH